MMPRWPFVLLWVGGTLAIGVGMLLIARGLSVAFGLDVRWFDFTAGCVYWGLYQEWRAAVRRLADRAAPISYGRARP